MLLVRAAITDEELQIIDDGLISTADLSANLAASLYYSCGYIAFKENVQINNEVDSNALPSSDFVDRVSRGGLAHPTNALYGFGRSCLHVFDAVVQKDNSQDHCRRRFEKMFGILGDSYPCDFGSKLKPVCRRLTNGS